MEVFMNLFTPRTWTLSDISLTKASSILLGAAIGLSLPKRCRGYAPLLLLGAAVLAAKPMIDYFRQEDEEDVLPEDNGDRTPAGENL
jgi:hypothetical protein